MEDLRTAAERAYDELKSGSAYTQPTPPTPPANPSAQLIDLVTWIEEETTASTQPTPPADPTNDGSPWQPIIDLITETPADDVCALCGASEDCDCDDGSAAEIAAELQPVPPVPSGYATDRAMIYQHFGDILISIDRRDCEMMICRNDSIEPIILPPDMALALAQFLNQPDMRQLTGYHQGVASVTA